MLKEAYKIIKLWILCTMQLGIDTLFYAVSYG